MSRYASAHTKTSGPGDARPTALQIIKDENLLNNLTSKTFLITGISAGIGIETVRALHATGAHIYGTVRNLAKGQKVVDEILAQNPNGGKIDLIEMDLSSLASVRKGAAEFLEKSGGKLNVLITNAGVMAVPEGRTVDGYEVQFGTNHLGHFLLFQLVKDALLSSATAEFPSRVVSVASTGHRLSNIRFDDYNFNSSPYEPITAYAQSKTANIWFANAIERHYGSQNLHATSVHPGAILTGLAWNISEDVMKAYDTPEWRAHFKSAEQGAATQVYAAVSEEWKAKGGKYLSNLVEQGKHSGEDQDDGFAEWAYNEQGEERLWRESLKMVGLE